MPEWPDLRRGCARKAHDSLLQAREWSLAHFGTVDKARLFQFAEKRSAEDIQEMARPRTWRVQIRNAQYQNLVGATASRRRLSRHLTGRGRPQDEISDLFIQFQLGYDLQLKKKFERPVAAGGKAGKGAKGSLQCLLPCAAAGAAPPPLTPSATLRRDAARCRAQGEAALHVGGDRDAGQDLPDQRRAQCRRGHRRCAAAPRARGGERPLVTPPRPRPLSGVCQPLQFHVEGLLL